MSMAPKPNVSRRLEAGKQRLSQKLMEMIEERDTIVAMINEFVAVNETMVAAELRESSSAKFYRSFPDINQKLHLSHSKLFMTRINLYSQLYDDVNSESSGSVDNLNEIVNEDFPSEQSVASNRGSVSSEPFVLQEVPLRIENEPQREQLGATSVNYEQTSINDINRVQKQCNVEQESSANRIGSIQENDPLVANINDFCEDDTVPVKLGREQSRFETCITPLGVLAQLEEKMDLSNYQNDLGQDNLTNSDIESEVDEESTYSAVTEDTQSPANQTYPAADNVQLQYNPQYWPPSVPQNAPQSTPLNVQNVPQSAPLNVQNVPQSAQNVQQCAQNVQQCAQNVQQCAQNVPQSVQNVPQNAQNVPLPQSSQAIMRLLSPVWPSIFPTIKIKPHPTRKYNVKITRFSNTKVLYVQLQDPFFMNTLKHIRHQLENLYVPNCTWDLKILKSNRYFAVIENAYRCRGKLNFMESGTLANISNLDTGEELTVPVNSIVPLNAELMKIPAQAVPCSLYKLSHLELSPDVLKDFQKFVEWNVFPVVFFSLNDRDSYNIEGFMEFEGLSITFTDYIEQSQFSDSQNIDCNRDIVSEPIITMPVEEKVTEEEPQSRMSIVFVEQVEMGATVNSSEVDETRNCLPEANYRDREGSIIQNVLTQSNISSDSSDEILEWDAQISTIRSDEILSHRSALMSYSVNPHEFYVHLVSEKSSLVDKQQVDMNGFYDKYNLPVDVYKKKKFYNGTFWCCKRPDDPNWYRVKIVNYKDELDSGSGGARIRDKRKGNCKIDVQAIDYGDTFEVSLRDIYPLTLNFTSLPALAVCFKLHQVEPLEGYWTPNVLCRFEQVISTDEDFDFEIINVLEENTYEVKLYTDYAEIGFIDIAQFLAKDGCLNCLYCEVELKTRTPTPEDLKAMDNYDPMKNDYFSLRNNYKIADDDAEGVITGTKCHMEKYVCRYFLRNGFCNNEQCHFEHIRNESGVNMDVEEVMLEKPAIIPKTRSTVFGMVSSSFNPGHFYLVFPFGTEPRSEVFQKGQNYFDKKTEFEYHTEALTTHCNKRSHLFEDLTSVLVLGSLVAAKSNWDNFWYRAKVVEYSSDELNGLVQVFFVDFGNQDSIRRTNIRTLKPEFYHMTIQAVECFLGNVSPMHSSNDQIWSCESMKYFKDLVEGKYLTVSIFSQDGNQTLYVDLIIADKEEQIKVGSALVSEGYAKFHSRKYRLDNVKTEKPRTERVRITAPLRPVKLEEQKIPG